MKVLRVERCKVYLTCLDGPLPKSMTGDFEGRVALIETCPGSYTFAIDAEAKWVYCGKKMRELSLMINAENERGEIVRKGTRRVAFAPGTSFGLQRSQLLVEVEQAGGSHALG